jgi:hypothetical protein
MNLFRIRHATDIEPSWGVLGHACVFMMTDADPKKSPRTEMSRREEEGQLVGSRAGTGNSGLGVT